MTPKQTISPGVGLTLAAYLTMLSGHVARAEAALSEEFRRLDDPSPAFIRDVQSLDFVRQSLLDAALLLRRSNVEPESDFDPHSEFTVDRSVEMLLSEDAAPSGVSGQTDLFL